MKMLLFKFILLINLQLIASTGGDEHGGSIFSRLGIWTNNLPKGCSTVLLSTCNNMSATMSSTAPWYQLNSNHSVLYTFGIVFVEINSLVMPLSITGIQVARSKDDFSLISGSLVLDPKLGTLTGNNRTLNCVSFNTTPRDIHDLLAHSSLFSTFFRKLEDILPDWLRFNHNGNKVIGSNDLRIDLVRGNEVQRGICRGAPLYDNRMYTVLTFGSGFSMTFYGKTINLPEAVSGKTYCFIIDICQDYGGSMFLILPEGSRDLLDNIDMFQAIIKRYGLYVRPIGLGVSLLKHIPVQTVPHSSAVQVWNGDQLFSYRVMTEANVWFEGEAKMNYSVVNMAGNAKVFMSVPKFESLLENLFLDEWNVLMQLETAAALELKIGSYSLRFNNLATTKLDVYASVGGAGSRDWCGANPEGLFMTLDAEVNPFHDIPILKSFFFDLSSGFNVFVSTYADRNVNSNTVIDLGNDIVNIRSVVKRFINVTVKTISRYRELLPNMSIQYLHGIDKSANNFINSLDVIINELVHVRNTSVSATLSHFISTVDKTFWKLWDKLRIDIQHFRDSIDLNNNIAIYNFSEWITSESKIIEQNVDTIVSRLTNQLVSTVENTNGFGLRFFGSLRIFGLEIASLQFELVYSSHRIGSCSKFSRAYNLLQGERAVRLYAFASTGVVKLFPFVRVHVAGGVSMAISTDSPGKFVSSMRGEITVFGNRVTSDIFIDNREMYSKLEINTWGYYKTTLEVSVEHGKTWNNCILKIKGRFGADGDGDGDFNDSYFSALTRAARSLADAAEKRISQAQGDITKAQDGLTDAQQWLEKKKDVVRNANSAFDAAVKKLDSAKETLERAKLPFEKAIDKLNKAQRDVDNLCRIRHCSTVCVPGIKCDICWKKVWFTKVPYPCCHFTDCMFSVPDPICVAFNVGCRSVRATAYGALEIAKNGLKIPMAVLDGAKVAVSAAQFIVDESRVVLDIAIGALDLAKFVLEDAKVILEGAKLALEAVKQTVKWGLTALSYIIRYGLENLFDVRNCGFEIQTETANENVFDIHCEVRAFSLDFISVQFRINFKDHIQSIWQAAKATIENILDKIGDTLSGRKRRGIQNEAMSSLHTILRKVRELDSADPGFDSYVNQTLIDVISRTVGFRSDKSGKDYENRKEIFEEKCRRYKTVIDFLTDSILFLMEMTKDSALTLKNISNIQQSINTFDINELAGNLSVENIIHDPNVAEEQFNLSIYDLQFTIQTAKSDLTRDELLNSIIQLSRDASVFLTNQTADSDKLQVVSHWISAMDNVTSSYFDNEKCASFLDCTHYSVSVLYELFTATNISGQIESLESVSEFENMLLVLTGNMSHTFEDVYDLLVSMQDRLETLDQHNMFCSKPPTMLSRLHNQTVAKGQSFSLTCNATGDPEPIFWWFKDDELLAEETKMILVIQNVSDGDSARYRCVAGNIVANLTFDEAQVKIQEPVVESLAIWKPGVEMENVIEDGTETSGFVIILVSTATLLMFIAGIAVFVMRYFVRRRGERQIVFRQFR